MALQSIVDDPEHTGQAHISFPSPGTPINLECPIEVRSETSVFRPRNIANLWTRLLSIHIQNGNFWKQADASTLHNEKMAAQTSRDEMEPTEDAGLILKRVLYLRYMIQKTLLRKDKQPTEEELPQINDFFKKLESYGDLDAHIFRSSNIHKVCKLVSNLENIPGEDTYHFKARAASIFERYNKIRNQENAILGGTPSDYPEAAAHSNPQPQTPPGFEEYTDKPSICLTQWTPEQCAQIEEAAQACNPPLDRGVVELMCLIPQFKSKYKSRDLQIVPLGKLAQPLDKFPDLDRGVYRGGPLIPPHMLQLTAQLSASYGLALYVDTRTGEGLELETFGPFEPGVVCKEFAGSRRPIEELLQEWINNFLCMKWVPSGGDDILPDGFRSMDYLKQKFLLQEYCWPSAFPLPPSDYASLIRRQSALYKERLDRWDNQTSLNLQWSRMQRKWHENNGTYKNYTSLDKQVRERFKALDGSVARALQYHVRKFEDREYSLAADVPLDPRYCGPLTLSSSSHVGDDWRVDITPSMIIERFNEVVNSLPQSDRTTDVETMKEVLDTAFERWELNAKGIYRPDSVHEEDDDETEDYEPSEDECSEEEEWEADEEDQELEFDVVILMEDAERDIEDVRKGLEGFQSGEE